MALAAAALLAGALADRLGRQAAFGLGLAAGLAVALSFTPALVWLTLPATGSLLRLAAPALLAAAAAAVAFRQDFPRRRAMAFGAVVIGAFVLGAWARAYFTLLLAAAHLALFAALLWHLAGELRRAEGGAAVSAVTVSGEAAVGRAMI